MPERFLCRDQFLQMGHLVDYGERPVLNSEDTLEQIEWTNSSNKNGEIQSITKVCVFLFIFITFSYVTMENGREWPQYPMCGPIGSVWMDGRTPQIPALSGFRGRKLYNGSHLNPATMEFCTVFHI